MQSPGRVALADYFSVTSNMFCVPDMVASFGAIMATYFMSGFKGAIIALLIPASYSIFVCTLLIY